MITITSTISGTPDSADIRAVDAVIDDENQRRARLDQDPPGTPLAKATNAERAASLKIIWDTNNAASWASERNKHIEQAAAFTGDELHDLKEAALDAVGRGLTASQIKAGIEAL